MQTPARDSKRIRRRVPAFSGSSHLLAMTFIVHDAELIINNGSHPQFSNRYLSVTCGLCIQEVHLRIRISKDALLPPAVLWLMIFNSLLDATRKTTSFSFDANKQVCLFCFDGRSTMTQVQTLYAPRWERICDWTKRIENYAWWTRCMLSVSCVSTPGLYTDGHEQRPTSWTPFDVVFMYCSSYPRHILLPHQ